MTLHPEYAFPKLSHLPTGERRRRVVFVASPTPHPLELIGPMNVLEIANFVFENSGRTDFGYDVEVVASQPGVVCDIGGLTMHVEKPFHRLRGPVDTLLLSPMNWEDLFDRNDTFYAWLRRMAGKVRRIGSICAATYVLAEAGLLSGCRATTHWDLLPDFRERYPDVDLEGEPIFVKHRNIYTSAGMTSGIDMTVALVEEDFGREVALRVAQAMVLFLKRPGGQAQFSVQLNSSLPDQSADLAELQSFIVEHVHQDLRVEMLAARLGMSPRNFSRVFTQEVGVAPGRFVERCRLEAARRYLEESQAPLSEVAERCGYSTADGMRLAFERALGVNPRTYRACFTTAKRA